MFKTRQIVPESGIYRVTHAEHRLPHEVTLLKDQTFPRCAKCGGEVTFEPLQFAPALRGIREHVVVYQLPEVGVEAPEPLDPALDLPRSA